MLRAARLPHSQPGALNCLLITKRCQQTTASTILNSELTKPKSVVNNLSSISKPQTTLTRSLSSNVLLDRTINPYKIITASASSSSSSAKTGSRPPRKSGGGVIKALVYGVTLGLTATLVYAEYENGPFRRQLEETIPYSSTVLGSIDQYLDPVLGRQKSLTPEVSEKVPDFAYVKDKVPDQEKSKTFSEQIKDTAHSVLEKLPDKAQIQKVGTQAKDAVSHAYEKITDSKKTTGAADQTTAQVQFSFSTI